MPICLSRRLVPPGGILNYSSRSRCWRKTRRRWVLRVCRLGWSVDLGCTSVLRGYRHQTSEVCHGLHKITESLLSLTIMGLLSITNLLRVLRTMMFPRAMAIPQVSALLRASAAPRTMTIPHWGQRGCYPGGKLRVF